MKIALFVPSFSGGGAERVAVYIANHLSERGHTVQLVAANATGPFKEDVLMGVQQIDFKSAHIFRTLPKLVRYLREEKPDLISAFQTHANVVAVLAKVFSGGHTKLVVREGNTPSLKLKKSNLLRNRILYKIIPWLYPLADGIVAISEGVKKDLRNLLPTKTIDVIYNPAVRADIAALASEKVEHPFFQADAPKLILSIGRLTAQKDHLTLLKAFAKVRQKLGVNLMILGVGGERQKLESFVEEHSLMDVVSLPGFVNNPYAYLAKSSVFVLSSRWEGFGIVLAEALACGAPVVSTDCPSGPAEILENGRYGVLVPVGDVDAMAGAICEILKSPLPPEMGITRAQDFSVEIGANKYLHLFESIVNE